MMSMDLSNISFLNIHGADYCCVINRISKSEAIKVMQNVYLTEKRQSIIKHKNLLSYIKIGKKNLTFGDTEIVKDFFLFFLEKFFYRYKSPIL